MLKLYFAQLVMPTAKKDICEDLCHAGAASFSKKSAPTLVILRRPSPAGSLAGDGEIRIRSLIRHGSTSSSGLNKKALQNSSKQSTFIESRNSHSRPRCLPLLYSRSFPQLLSAAALPVQAVPVASHHQGT